MFHQHLKHSVLAAAPVARTMYQNAAENGQKCVAASRALPETNVGMPAVRGKHRHMGKLQ